MRSERAHDRRKGATAVLPRYDTQNTGEAVEPKPTFRAQRGSPSVKLAFPHSKRRAIEHSCANEVDVWLRRRGTSARLTVSDTILTVRIQQRMATAERELTSRETGREFFQYYLLKLAGQMTPAIQACIERTLGGPVSPLQVEIDRSTCDILFRFELDALSSRTIKIK